MTVTVQVPVNFGSDTSTQVDATSSGDTAVTIADRWIVTSDGPPLGDPVNTTVLYGPGSPSLTPASYTQTVFSCAGTEGLGATFSVSVPAASSRALMFFAGLGDIAGTGNSIAGAAANATVFDSVATLNSSTDLLTGVTLNTSQSALILNWENLSVPLPQQARGPVSAPVASKAVLALWIVVLACLGAAWQLRRQHAGGEPQNVRR